MAMPNLQADLTAAMKAGDKARVSVVRMLRAKLQEAEIAAGAPLKEEQAAETIARYAKQIRESIDGFVQGGRDEQKRAAEAELAIVESYLPKQLSDEEITAIIKDAVAKSGAAGAKDLGKLMAVVMPQVKGKADGKKVNQIARSLLGA